jgi:hypothetical protein
VRERIPQPRRPLKAFGRGFFAPLRTANPALLRYDEGRPMYRNWSPARRANGCSAVTRCSAALTRGARPPLRPDRAEAEAAGSANQCTGSVRSDPHINLLASASLRSCGERSALPISYAAAIASLSSSTRTLRPSRSSRIATRSRSFIPSNSPRQVSKAPLITRT